LSELDTLIQLLAKLPGLGPRSARRAALHLIKRRESLLDPLAAAMARAAEAAFVDEAEAVVEVEVVMDIDQIDLVVISREDLVVEDEGVSEGAAGGEVDAVVLAEVKRMVHQREKVPQLKHRLPPQRQHPLSK